MNHNDNLHQNESTPHRLSKQEYMTKWRRIQFSLFCLFGTCSTGCHGESLPTQIETKDASTGWVKYFVVETQSDQRYLKHRQGVHQHSAQQYQDHYMDDNDEEEVINRELKSSDSGSGSGSSGDSRDERYHYYYRDDDAYDDEYRRNNRDDDFYAFGRDPLPPSLFPLTQRTVVGLMVSALFSVLGSMGGIGGGGLVVPCYIIAVGLPPRIAIPLGSVTAFGGSLAGLILNLRRRHPLADRPIIDWDLVLVMEPLVLVGALSGAILHRVVSEKILMVLLVFLLSIISHTTLSKARRMYEAESRYIEHLRAAKSDIDRIYSFRSAFRTSGWSCEAVPGDDEDTYSGGEPECKSETPERKISRVSPNRHTTRSRSPLPPLAPKQALSPPKLPPSSSQPTSPNTRSSPIPPLSPLSPLSTIASSNYKVGIPPKSGTSSKSGIPNNASHTSNNISSPRSQDSLDDSTKYFPSYRARPLSPGFSMDSKTTVDRTNSRLGHHERQRILILNPDFVTLRTDLMEQEKVTPRSKIIALLGKFSVLIFLNITLGGGAFSSPWGIQCGSLSFWVVHVIMVAFLIASAWAAQTYLTNRHEIKEIVSFDYVRGDIKWEPRTAVIYPLFFIGAGVCAGMFGIGGGMITVPLMLAMGVHPAVVGATSGTMVFFTSTLSVSSFAVFDLILWDFAAFCLVLGFSASLFGQSIMQKARQAGAENFERNSLIALSIGGVIMLSALLITLQYLFDIIMDDGSTREEGGLCEGYRIV